MVIYFKNHKNASWPDHVTLSSASRTLRPIFDAFPLRPLNPDERPTITPALVYRQHLSRCKEVKKLDFSPK